MLKIAWSEVYAHPLPDGHRFPMQKYELLPEQLIYEGTVQPDNFFAPKELEEYWVLRTHDETYWEKLKTGTLTRSEERKTGFPFSQELLRRELIITQGTIDASLFALEFGVAMNIAGGTHHAFTNRGEGFCLLNDIAVASNYLLDQALVSKVLVIDLDVHQGNGTAEIFQEDDRVFTFSMHGAKNYPLHKEKSDFDIALEDGTGDERYLSILEKTINTLIEEVTPDFIFFLAGVDVLYTDKLGRLGLSIEGCKQRDRFVFECCRRYDLPVVTNMGGGYSEKLTDIIEAHANTYRLAQDIYF